jgi:hypothetical protein
LEDPFQRAPPPRNFDPIDWRYLFRRRRCPSTSAHGHCRRLACDHHDWCASRGPTGLGRRIRQGAIVIQRI